MSSCCHKQIARPARRGWGAAAGTLSLAVWLLTPKCPMCLAVYVSLWTGLGLSLVAATWLHWSLLVVSSGLLLYCVGRRICPAAAAGRSHAVR